MADLDVDDYYSDDLDDYYSHGLEDYYGDGVLEDGDDNCGWEAAHEPVDGTGDDDDCGLHEDQEMENVGSAMEKAYVVLTEDGVRARQEEDVAMVCEVLSVPPGFAAVLLRHFKWSPDLLQEAWFLDEWRVRDAVGLPPGGAAPMLDNSRRPLTCAICCDQFFAGWMRSAGCSHFYCVECWRGYVRAAVVDGPRCLSLRRKDKEWYATFALRSYVEESTRLKWCPGPECTVAVEFIGGGGGEDMQDDVECGHEFCGQCGEQAHRPVSCETVRAWTEKNALESKTASWVLENVKHCPRCRLPIEKNQGCMHMTCRPPCRHEFCWLCLRPWDQHKTGESVFGCNVYNQAKAAGEVSLEEEQRKQAMASQDRYLHFYERWAAHGKARQRAVDDMADLESRLEELFALTGVPVTDLGFLPEAYQQIAECRRLLRWTYAYGYYHLGTGRDADEERRTMVECAQGEAERQLERLHECAEHEREELVATVMKMNAPSKQVRTAELEPEEELRKKQQHKGAEMVMAYRQKLAGLTGVTKTFFRNLVRAFQDGLSEAGPAAADANPALSSGDPC
uniref:RBR-type E3 ubiquitin transferase n=1 Tax=Oryza brachyantha TaxID=4533 RepID=J3N025_ORYBR